MHLFQQLCGNVSEDKIQTKSITLKLWPLHVIAQDYHQSLCLCEICDCVE